MAISSPLSLLFLTFSLLIITLSAKPLNLKRPQFIEEKQTTKRNDKSQPPTRFFEVTKPIKTTNLKKCSHRVLSHSFASTYGKPPVTVQYNPPSHCGPTSTSELSKIVLEWSATCKGRQFDRIFGIWLAGVELLRSCTAEPRATGIVWTVEKDITRYYSLLANSHNQTLSVYLGNIVDDTYTGVYHVNVSFHYYYDTVVSSKPRNHWADLVLPVSRNLPLNDGLWFEIKNSTDSSGFKDVKIPRNAYRAVLEVYVSFHENDEFWYGNYPNEYLEANHIVAPGNGAFREVVVSLDGETVGAIWPFTVVFTGGINPLLWRPISAIGSFDLPSYDIEITPSLGKVLDGKSHAIGFSVSNALNVWFVGANLHLWLDDKSRTTEGGRLAHLAPPVNASLSSNFSGFNGTFLTRMSRSLSLTGWVKSSHGNMTASFAQDLFFTNKMILGNFANKQIVDQTIYFNDSVSAYDVSSPWSVHLSKSSKKFSFYMYSDAIERGNVTVYVSDLSLGFDEKKSEGSASSELRNVQNGQGNMVVKDNLVQSGLGSIEQVYKYVGPELCYFRNISSSNYTIFYDHVRHKCDRVRPEFGNKVFRVHRLWPFHGTKVESTL